MTWQYHRGIFDGLQDIVGVAGHVIMVLDNVEPPFVGQPDRNTIN